MIIVKLKPCIITIHVTISKLGYKFTDNINFYYAAEHQDNYLVSPLHLHVYNKINKVALFPGVHYLELEHLQSLLYWLTWFCYGLETVHNLSAEYS